LLANLLALYNPGALGYDEDPLASELRENEFGYRKRMGEEALSASGLSHVIVRV